MAGELRRGVALSDVRGRCPECGRVWALRQDGKLRAHRRSRATLAHCAGSARAPVPIEEVPLCTACGQREPARLVGLSLCVVCAGIVSPPEVT